MTDLVKELRTVHRSARLCDEAADRIEAHQNLTSEDIENYMLEMGYGWQQAYSDLNEMIQVNIKIQKY